MFISQKTPITFKENFQIDIINGLIHVYIPNANYDTDKLKIAIDIIDNLSSKMDIINNTNIDENYSIDKKDIDELADEYRNFAMRKLSMQETIKTLTKQLSEQLECIQLPNIKNILIKFGIIENENLKCPDCNYNAKNKASLSAHARNCKYNLKNKIECEIIINDNEIINPKNVINEEIIIKQTKNKKQMK